MKKKLATFFAITIFISLCFLNVSPLRVRAKEKVGYKPEVINTSVWEVIREGIDSSGSSIEEENVLEVLLEGEDDNYEYGSKKSLGIEENSIIAFELFGENRSNLPSDSVFKAVTPRGDEYKVSIGTRKVLVLRFNKGGQYSFSVDSGSGLYFGINAFRMRSPLFDQVGFVGPDFDFDRYQNEVNRHISFGYPIFVYNNSEAEEFFEIQRKEVEVNNEKVKKLTSVELLLDQYNENASKFENLTSPLPYEVLMRYRNINLAIAIRGSNNSGKVIILNPLLFTLEESDLQKALKDISSNAEINVESDSELLIFTPKMLLIFGIIILAIGYLLFGELIEKFFTKENFLKTLGKKLAYYRKKLGWFFFILNLLLFSLVSILFVVSAYITRLMRSDDLDMRLDRAFGEVGSYIDSLGFEFISYFVVFFLILEAGILAWLRWPFIARTRNKILNLIGSIDAKKKRLLSRAFLWLFFLSTLITGLLIVCGNDSIFQKVLAIIGVMIAGLALAFGSKEVIQFSAAEGVIVKIYKVSLLLLPLILILTILNNYFLPFGLSRTKKFNLEDLEINTENADLSVLGNGYNLNYTSQFSRKDVRTELQQVLTSSQSVNLGLEYQDGGKQRTEEYLFFDEDLIKFPFKRSFGELYVYSKSDLTKNVSSIKDIASYAYRIGLDKSVYSNDVLRANQKDTINGFDYYKSGDEFSDITGLLNFDLTFRGNVVFYTVLENDLNLRLNYTDLNQAPGRDMWTMNVTDSKGETVASKWIEDDNVPVWEGETTREIALRKNNIEKGVYKIEISGGDIGGTAEINKDIWFSGFSINSSKLVMSSLDESDVEFVDPTKLYTVPTEERIGILQNISENSFSSEDCQLPREDAKKFDIRSEGIEEFSLECANQKVIGEYNMYSLSRESYFYPFSSYFTEIDASDNIVITKSDLGIEKLDDGWYRSEIVLPEIDYEFGEDVSLGFYSNSIKDLYNSYVVETVTLNFKDS